MNSYVGITYPKFLSWKIWAKPINHLWKKFLCNRNIHLFDEVWSQEHYLSCDACDLIVYIALIETLKKSLARIHKGKYLHTTITEID